jgi:hypothetical protein
MELIENKLGKMGIEEKAKHIENTETTKDMELIISNEFEHMSPEARVELLKDTKDLMERIENDPAYKQEFLSVAEGIEEEIQDMNDNQMDMETLFEEIEGNPYLFDKIGSLSKRGSETKEQ